MVAKSSCCGDNCASIPDWNGIISHMPKNPNELIARASLDSIDGVLINTEYYSLPGTGGWLEEDLPHIVSAPTCHANGADDFQKVSDAEQWNFIHLTWNSSQYLAVPLRNKVFLRGGLDWNMQIPIHIVHNIQNGLLLSLIMNAGTRGDSQGTIPAIYFAGEYETGEHILTIVLKQTGFFQVGLKYDVEDTSVMFEMDWRIV